jgi:hypothetical protein
MTWFALALVALLAVIDECFTQREIGRQSRA